MSTSSCRFAVVLAAVIGAPPAARAADSVDFVRDIQPIFKESCVECHGPQKQKGRLRLDSKTAIKGGESERAIVPGSAGTSTLVELLVSGDADERMPRKAPPLAKEKIDLIRAWIDQGAPWPDAASTGNARHWAYQKPVRRPPPAVKNAAWVKNPVDAFIAAEHEARGLEPRPEAARNILLRRVYLDLIGLPPTRAELDAFLADPSPRAFETVVDRLLADPRYGERWGRHFMDVWRYSDWAGFNKEVRESQKHIWRWRDWIVNSLNADKGYDRMALEMLAGDELAPSDPQALAATGFLVRSWYKFNRNTWLQTVVEHTGKAFLATTFNCARCHSHKYDPISQQEYFRFRAIFEPYDVRTDRLPGQADIDVDGLPRIYDARPNEPTYLFVRGDDAKPDKSKVMEPGLPDALGGPSFGVQSVPLPAFAIAPDRREFVIRDNLAAGAQAILTARSKVEQLTLDIKKGQASALEELPLAVLDVPIAEARSAALAAAVRAQELESASDEDRDAWKQAATEAVAAERRLAALEGRKNQLLAQRAVDRSRASTERALLASSADPESEDLETDLDKQMKALAEAMKKLGEADKALEKVQREAALPAGTRYTPPPVTVYPETSTGRRLALGRWIASPDNPLTARVAVNHIWQRHFGKPIVPTMFEFGSHGRPPSHPALLDWLATELTRQNWSVKKLHRLLVTSSAYRMDSTPDAKDLAIDKDNTYLWRMNSHRMEAELVRDSILSVARELDPTRGGPEIDQNLGLTSHRRSLYFRHAAEKQMEFLTLFDAASVTECYSRTETVVPQQALALANSSLSTEMARIVAGRLVQHAPRPGAFVVAAFEEVLGRPPRDAERLESEEFLSEQSSLVGESTARDDLVHVLFNHHDFVTIR